MVRKIKNISNLDPENNSEKVIKKVKESQDLSYNTTSMIKSFSISDNNDQPYEYYQYIENKDYSRSFLSPLRRKSKNPFKTTKRKILSLFKKKKSKKYKDYEKGNSIIENADLSHPSSEWLSSSKCSPSESSGDQMTDNKLINNSKYQFIMKRIRDKNNEPFKNEDPLLTQSNASHDELESIVPSTQLELSNKIQQNQLSLKNSLSQINNNNKQNQHENENATSINNNNTKLITPPTTPVQTSIAKSTPQPSIIPPLTPESINNSQKEKKYYTQESSSNIPSTNIEKKHIVVENAYSNKQIKNEFNIDSKNQEQLPFYESKVDSKDGNEINENNFIFNKKANTQVNILNGKIKVRNISKNSLKTSNNNIIKSSTDNNTNINLNKDTPPTPEYIPSFPTEIKKGKSKKHKKIKNKVKKFFKKAFSPFSHKKNNSENVIYEPSSNYNKSDNKSNDLVGSSSSSKKEKSENKDSEFLTSSSLSSKNLTTSPENMDSFEDDNLRKTHRINKYDSASNWNSALGQYISKMKKGDKPKKKMTKKSSTSLSNVISVGSKTVSTVSSSFSTISSSASSTISKNNMTLAATIDPSSDKTNSKNDKKRYALIFDNQKVRQEFEKVKNEENINNKNPKVVSEKENESWSTESGSYIDESSGIKMKLDESEHIELKETEKNKDDNLNIPKSELDTWNDVDLETNPTNTTEVINVIEEENLKEGDTEDWDTISESDSSFNSVPNQSTETAEVNININESLSNSVSKSDIRKKSEQNMTNNSLLVEETSHIVNNNQTLSLKNGNETSMDTSLTTSIFKSSPFIESYMNSITSSQIDHEIVKSNDLKPLNEVSVNDDNNVVENNDENIGSTLTTISTEVIKTNEDADSTINSTEKSDVDREGKVKLLAEAVNLYKDSINNEQYNLSLNKQETLSHLKPNKEVNNNYTPLSPEITNEASIPEDMVPSTNTKLPLSPVSSLEDDESESKDDNDDDSSSVCAVVDEPMSSSTYSTISTEETEEDPNTNNIYHSDMSLSNKRSINSNLIATSRISHPLSNNNHRSKESLSTNRSSKMPSLINKTSSLGATPSMISTSTTTTSNPSSHFSNIPDLVTDISGYASTSIPMRSSFSVPTTLSTSSSDVYSPLLSSDIPKMPSNASIGIIGGNSESQRITTYINKSLDTRRYSSSRDDENVYNSSFNDMDINQSSIPNTGLIQKMEFSPIDDSSSTTESSNLPPPKMNYESPTVLDNIRPPLPPKDDIYKNMQSKYTVVNDNESDSNEETSVYDSSYTSNESSYYYHNRNIKLNTNIQKGELLQIPERKDSQTKSVYSGSSLLVINDPREKSNNAISKFYSEKEIEQIENKDDNYLNISKEFIFNNGQTTDEDTSYVIEDINPPFKGEYNISNIKNDESNYLIKSKSYSYKEYGEDTRRDMIYEFCRMLSKKYDKENMLEDISSNFDDDNSTTLNPRQESNDKYIEFSFERTSNKLLNNEDFHDNKYLDNSQVLTTYHINLPTISLPPPLSPKYSNTKIEKASTPTQPLWKVEEDIIKKEAHMEYNKPFDKDQKRFSNLNSNYYGRSSPVQPSHLSYHPKIEYKVDKESQYSDSSSCSRSDTCSCSSCQSDSKEYPKMERRNHSGIMEKSISNIEEYNRSKNEIIIDQEIIEEVFTEKSKNDFSSTASFYSVSRSSFDDVGFDFFHNEYNHIFNSNEDNYNMLVGASEKLKFYYLDAADIYGINSNLRNNSDIPVINSSSFKNPDFLLGSVNTIHAFIDYEELKFKNSCIMTNKVNNHYYVPDMVDVVLKVLKPGIDKQKLKSDIKLINEWVCLQRFNPIYGVSTYFNEEVLVTQFYKNGSLGQYLTNNSSISFEEKEEFIVEIVEGLNICHSHDLVHGNLKPSNILLDEYYHALLTDFSTSHMSPSSPNGIQRQWLAPEHKEHSAPLTPASDIYSLGLIIYFIFNDGIRYYPNNTSHPTYLDKDWPSNILTILDHCLQENPNDRWTIKEVLNHLKMHYQFGSIADKYLNRKSSNRIFSEGDSKSKNRFNQDTDLSYYNRYPKLERFRKFNRYNQYYHHEDNTNNNKELQFALRALKNSLYFSDWNYTQAMKLLTGSKDVPCNIPKAIQRLVIPCSEGHIDSLLRLGLCYFDGLGVARNTAKAYKLWQIAVEIFPNRHALGGKYQQINKNQMAMNRTSIASPSSNYMRLSVGTINNGPLISPPHTPMQPHTPNQPHTPMQSHTQTLYQNITPSSKISNPSLSIKSPVVAKSLYMHSNGSTYSYDSLLQKKQNLRGFIKCNERTFDLWKEVAERKYVPAYVILGQCYRDGILVESDIAKALIWFKHAAHMNDINGCWYLALCYFIYYDNYQDAYTWLLKASKKQHPEADTALGLLYYYGLGVPRDVNKALDHFQYAADLGNAQAQYLYCECLNYIFKEKERTIPKSITLEEKSVHYDKLFHYCSMAATQGNSRAQFLLGKLYLDGSLKFINNASSNYKFNSSIGLQWIRLSAENGYKKAKEFLIEIL
jgi:TPR repeat protein